MWKVASAFASIAAVILLQTALPNQDAVNVWLPIIVGPVAEPDATPTPTPTPTPTATATATPTDTPTATPTITPAAGPCLCTADLYNCSDFATQPLAQACFDYCIAQVGFDVHHLDADGNGLACESLPNLSLRALIFPYTTPVP